MLSREGRTRKGRDVVRGEGDNAKVKRHGQGCYDMDATQ